MPQNRFYLPTPFLSGEEVALEGGENIHLTRVMRALEGDRVELVNGLGDLASAVVKTTDKERSFLKLTKVTHKKKKPGLIIAQALLRSSKLDLIVEKGTELGMEEIWFFPAARSEKTFLKENQIKRLEEIAIQATKQCGRLYLPKIEVFSSFPSFALPAFYGALENPPVPFAKTLSSCEKTAVFFIGPEGGFTKGETTLLKKQGVQGVSLHPNVLRTETAPLAALAIFYGSFRGE